MIKIMIYFFVSRVPLIVNEDKIVIIVNVNAVRFFE